MAKHILLIFITLFLGSVSLIINSSEIMHLSLQKTSALAQTSLLQPHDTLSPSDNANISILMPTSLHATQSTIDILTKMYEDKNFNSFSERSFDELVSLTNLNAFLVSDEHESREIDTQLNNALLDRIANSKRPADLMALEHINPHVAEGLFNTLFNEHSYRKNINSFLSSCVCQAKESA